METGDEGTPPVDIQESPKCNGCGNQSENVLNCSGCQAASYCGTECQGRHWKQHKVLCLAIRQLENEETEKIKEACISDRVPPKDKEIIAQLVGKQCTIKGRINGMDTECLWDTGSQVALIGKQWILQNIAGDVKIRPLEEMLGPTINLEAAGGSKITYEGYVQMKFGTKSQEIMVPFLVTTETINRPIIGYNVISRLTQSDANIIRDIVGDEMDEPVVVSLIDVLTSQESATLSAVRMRKQAVVIKAGQTQVVPCQIDSLSIEKPMTVLFDPQYEGLPDGLEICQSLIRLKNGINSIVSVTVVNKTAEERYLPGHCAMGELEQVTSVTPCDVRQSSEKWGNVSMQWLCARRQLMLIGKRPRVEWKVEL